MNIHGRQQNLLSLGSCLKDCLRGWAFPVYIFFPKATKLVSSPAQQIGGVEGDGGRMMHAQGFDLSNSLGCWT